MAYKVKDLDSSDDPLLKSELASVSSRDQRSPKLVARSLVKASFAHWASSQSLEQRSAVGDKKETRTVGRWRQTKES